MSNRRLASIMFADIEGYTALMQQNEKLAKENRSRFRNVLQSCHEEYEGEIKQFYGDGALSIFNSGAQAVRCAIAIQLKLRRPPEVAVRIGLHSGDVVLEGDDLFGDSINLTSRIESMSVPGAVLISGKLEDEVRNQPDIETRFLGSFLFKNVQKEMDVYAIVNPGLVVPERSELKGKLADSYRSIAVLPFANMSADPDNEYFADGISEEILNVLTRVEGLNVTARTSSFAFKGQNKDVREIARILEVQTILEGSVRKAGQRVRITAQLIDANKGKHIFSESFDRTLDDVFAIQDEIAQKITSRLTESLGAGGQTAPGVTKTKNLEAYDYYLKGMYHFGLWEGENAKRAIPCFEKAITLQEDFAEPYAQISLCYTVLSFSKVLPWEESYQKVKKYSDQALELNPNLVESYIALSLKYLYEWDWKKLSAAVDKIMNVNPGKSISYFPQAVLYQVYGDYRKAETAFLKAIELDPLSFTMNLYLSYLYIWEGQYEKAEKWIQKLSEFHPENRTVIETKGWLELFKGNPAEALAHFEELDPELGYIFARPTSKGYAHALSGQTQQARECLRRLEDLEKQNPNINFNYEKAMLHAALGDRDRAFTIISRMVRNRESGMAMFLKIDRVWMPLWEDPRFEEYVEKVTG